MRSIDSASILPWCLVVVSSQPHATIVSRECSRVDSKSLDCRQLTTLQADSSRHSRTKQRQSGSTNPNVDSNLSGASTPYAGLRADVGYSAVVIGNNVGLATLPMIAWANSNQLADP